MGRGSYASVAGKLPPGWRKIKIPAAKGFYNHSCEAYINTQTFKIQYDAPKWHGDFDYEKCHDFQCSERSMQDRICRHLSRHWKEIATEKGPYRDSELEDMIQTFLQRKESW